MKLEIRVSAPGKIILLGEHAVVYGKPAIIASAAKCCFITLSSREDKTIEIAAENFGLRETLDVKKIIGITKKANKDWQEYVETNDIAVLKSITERPVDYAAIIIGETLAYFHKRLSSGFSLSIDMEIPIGCGMGSSAALAVSIAGALMLFLGEKWNLEKINAIAFLAEQKRHGLPSGGDNSACCYGGLIWYRKETNDVKIIQSLPFSIPPHIANNFVLVDTGRPVESTGEMVGSVALLRKIRPKFIEDVFVDQEVLTKQLIGALGNGREEEIIHIIQKGEKNLEKIGVVSTKTKSLIREIERINGAAKICGAGGRKKGSGMLLAYHKNKRELEKFLGSLKVHFLSIMLGAEGVREEL